MDKLKAEIQDLRAMIGEIADSVRDSANERRSLIDSVQRVMDHLANLQDDHDVTKVGLWEKTDALQDHVGALQAAHDDLKSRSWTEAEHLRRLETLWSDLQREVTVLAASLARIPRE